MGVGPHVMYVPSIDRHLPEALKRLRNEFNFVVFENIPIHQSIRAFAGFVSKGKRHEWDENLDEAFLHFMIALDLLFGEEGKSTDSVSKRTAAVTYLALDRSYEDQVKQLKKMYAERSKYVHEGRSPSPDFTSESEKACAEVLLCMLRLQKDAEQRSSLTMNQWLRNIDLLAATLEAQRPASGDLMLACGVAEKADGNT